MLSTSLSGCLDFSTCAWCQDAGSDAGCSHVNLWPGDVVASLAAEACVIDSGFTNGGGMGAARCEERAPPDGGQIHLAIAVNFVADAGTVFCTHADVAGSSVIMLDLQCQECVGQCACSDIAGCNAETTGSGSSLTSGPFTVLASMCPNFHVNLHMAADAGVFEFSNWWVWIPAAGAGCSWDDDAGCPSP